MRIFNLSYICHDMNTFWPASIVKYPWHCWTEFSQSRKHLRKTLWSQENLQSLTYLSGANIGVHSNSRDSLFLMFMMSKINPLMKKSVLFWKDVWTVFFIFIKNSRNAIRKCEHVIARHALSTCIEYIKLYQNCTDSDVLVCSNVMWNIRNKVGKKFVRTK